MFSFAVGRYVVHLQPIGQATPAKAGTDWMRDVDDEGQDDDSRLHLAVDRADDGQRVLEVRRRYSPGNPSGFWPAAAFIEETGVLFISAGAWAAAYDVELPAKLWEEQVELGAWSWSRHKGVVLLSSELSLTAWDIAGRKLWSRFVEPPWTFSVSGDEVHLEVMGERTSFPLHSGPATPCR